MKTSICFSSLVYLLHLNLFLWNSQFNVSQFRIHGAHGANRKVCDGRDLFHGGSSRVHNYKLINIWCIILLWIQKYLEKISYSIRGTRCYRKIIHLFWSIFLFFRLYNITYLLMGCSAVTYVSVNPGCNVFLISSSPTNKQKNSSQLQALTDFE